jgi:hypothetical protein
MGSIQRGPRLRGSFWAACHFCRQFSKKIMFDALRGQNYPPALSAPSVVAVSNTPRELR